MFLSTAGPSTFDFAVAPAGSIESGLRRMLTWLACGPRRSVNFCSRWFRPQATGSGPVRRPMSASLRLRPNYWAAAVRPLVPILLQKSFCTG